MFLVQAVRRLYKKSHHRKKYSNELAFFIGWSKDQCLRRQVDSYILKSINVRLSSTIVEFVRRL
jgi:hypothetical protein